MSKKHHSVEVWAHLVLCPEDTACLREFFTYLGVPPAKVVRRPHLTVYHCRRRLPGLTGRVEEADVLVSAAQTRFMVLAPGGENPRPDLDPAQRKVGIRIQKSARDQINAYRARLVMFESKKVLGSRSPSTMSRSAFGARVFQPHVTLLRPGSGIGRDLTPVGKLFRSSFTDFWFDRFEIKLVIARRDGLR